MDNGIQVVGVIVDAITGNRVGSVTRHVSTVMEVISGDGIGGGNPAAHATVVEDAIVGYKVGMKLNSPVTEKEVIAGQRVGQDIQPVFNGIFVEVIGRDSSYKLASTTKETIIYAPDDQVMIRWQARAESQQVAQHRPPMTAPPQVWSLNTVGVYRQLVGRSNKRTAPISVEEVRTVRGQVAMKAARPSPANVLSMMRVGSIRQIVAKSRNIAYTPSSGNYVLSYRANVAQARIGFIAPSQARSADIVGQHRQLVALSKRASYQINVPQLFELVARTRIVTFSAPTSAKEVVEQVAQARMVGMPHSSIEARTDVQQVAQHRDTPGILRSTIVTITYSGMVAQKRDVGMPHSLTSVAQDVQQVAQHRDPIHYWSNLHVPVERQLVAQHRVPGPLPYTGEYAQSVRALVAQHRVVLLPNQISDWRVAAQRQLIAQHAVTSGIQHSFIEVRSELIQYALAADYLPPNLVMGPETGAFVRQQYALAAQHRQVDSPQTQVKESIFMYEVGQVPVVGDAFPPKDTSYTTSDAFMVAEQVAVSDTMPQPTAAYSDVTGFSVTSPVAIGDDTLPDPSLSVSDAITVALHEVVAVADDMPYPLIPLSDAQAFTVGQFAAVGDASLPDPRQPTSEVETRLVGALPLVGEAFSDPREPTSSVDMFALCGFAVIRDTSMLRIPPRANRARPVITVSTS